MEQLPDILLTLGGWKGKQNGWQDHECAQDRRSDQGKDGLPFFSLEQQVVTMQTKHKQQTQQMDIRQTEQQKVIEHQLVPGGRTDDQTNAKGQEDRDVVVSAEYPEFP